MKFGLRFREELQYPGWESYYIRYGVLKKVIRIMKEDIEKFKEEEEDESESLTIYNNKFAELLLEDINNAYTFLLDRCEMIHQRKKENITGIDHSKHLVTPRIEITTPKRYKEREISTGVRSPHDSYYEDLQQFAIHLEELQELRFFASVNLEAVRKITKKFCKQTKLILLDDKIKKHPLFGIVEKLDDYCENIEQMYRSMRMKCATCDFNIKEIRAVIQSKLVSEKKNRLQMENKKNLTVPWRQHLYEKVLDIHAVFHPVTLLKGTLIIPLITLVITYTISSFLILEGTGGLTIFDKKGYFISASIDQPPASCLGTLGLCLTLYCLSMVVYVKYKITSNMLRGHNTIYHRLSFYCAIFSMFCGVGVASYQHHNARGTHNLFAVNFFVWGVIHICMECFLEWKCKLEPNKKLTQLRIFLAVVTCINVVIFVSGVYLGAIHTVRNGKPRNLFILNIAAAAEVLMFFSFMFYFGSYYPLFYNAQVEIIVRDSSQIRKIEEATQEYSTPQKKSPQKRKTSKH